MAKKAKHRHGLPVIVDDGPIPVAPQPITRSAQRRVVHTGQQRPSPVQIVYVVRPAEETTTSTKRRYKPGACPKCGGKLRVTSSPGKFRRINCDDCEYSIKRAKK
jgi:hypothetical protein